MANNEARDPVVERIMDHCRIGKGNHPGIAKRLARLARNRGVRTIEEIDTIVGHAPKRLSNLELEQLYDKLGTELGEE